MPRELYRDSFARFTLDPNRRCLELEWFEATATMSDDDFKAALVRLADYSETHGARRVVVDVRAFRHRPGPEIMGWRDATIIPRYNAAGIAKFAFLLPEGAAERPAAPEGPANFPTGWFSDRDRMEAWFDLP